MRRDTSPYLLALAAVVIFAATPCAHSQDVTAKGTPAGPRADIRAYITSGWDTLSRSMSECKSVVDPKITTTPILYLPAGMAKPEAVAEMQRSCKVDVEYLPRPIRQIGNIQPQDIAKEGLLYLPNRYVVPGGRFNEMYGWDSYFILLGLVADHRTELARGMVENFFFEIENYGAILNANRTYFFTRSQPPFLSSMIRAVYKSPAPGETPDLKWLARAYTYAKRDYALWVSPFHRAGNTGLARFYDYAAGPVPEMADDSNYYPDVIRWLLAHPGEHAEYLIDAPEKPNAVEAASLASTSCDVRISHVCAHAVVKGHRLTAAFYKGDRAMRESGFDTSFRFGPFSGSTDHYAPVCLNSLLFKYELDMEHFAQLLGRRNEAAEWQKRAEARRAAINRYLWDPAAKLYLDYDFTTKQRSTYHYVTTFYPLWAGVASASQAAAVRSQLKIFEQPGGLAESDVDSGTQWDLPYGWAPTTWIAVAGLDRAGFHEDAARIARSFSTTVRDNYLRDGTIREKYDVVSGTANFKVATGYKSNVVGFGWTNGTYLKMQEILENAKAAPAAGR